MPRLVVHLQSRWSTRYRFYVRETNVEMLKMLFFKKNLYKMFVTVAFGRGWGAFKLNTTQ